MRARRASIGACRSRSSAPSSSGGSGSWPRLRAALARTARRRSRRRPGRRRGRRRQEPAAARPRSARRRRRPGAHRRLHRAGRRGPAARAARRGAAHAGPDDVGRRPRPAARPGPPRARPAAARAGPGRRPSPAAAAGQHGAAVRARCSACSAGSAPERPLVLVVEDLHWADRSTLDLVAFLVRALQGTRVLLVLTYRSDEVDRRSPLRPLLSGWERLRGVERLQLERFDRARGGGPGGGDPRRARRRRRWSTSSSTGPRATPSSSRSSCAPCATAPTSTSCRRPCATCCCPAPSGCPVRRSGCCAPPPSPAAGCPSGCSPRSPRCPPAELYEALREAVDASLLVVDGTGRGYAFRHALTRDAVYEDLLPGERVELHTAYAEALDRDPGLAGDDASVPATLAVHWYAAHDLPRALAASVRGRTAGHGRVRAGRGAPPPRAGPRGVAQRAGRRDAGPAPTRWRCCGCRARRPSTAATRSGRCPCCSQALDLVDAGRGPGAGRAASSSSGRGPCARSARTAPSVAALEEALARLPEDPPTLARAAVLASLANTLMRLGAERGPDVGRTALAAARAVGAREQEASALLTLGSSLSYLEDPDEGEAALREGLRLALDADDHETALRGYVNLSDALEARGRHRGGRRRRPRGHRARRTGRAGAQLRRLPDRQPRRAAGPARRVAGGRAAGDGGRWAPA